MFERVLSNKEYVMKKHEYANNFVYYPISNNGLCPICGYEIFIYKDVFIDNIYVDILVECTGCNTIYILDREERTKYEY